MRAPLRKVGAPENEYANARDVLPEALLRRVQRYWAGMLWVPPPDRRRFKTRGHEERNGRMRRDRRRGLSLGSLAKKYRLSRERVRQIVASGKRLLNS